VVEGIAQEGQFLVKNTFLILMVGLAVVAFLYVQGHGLPWEHHHASSPNDTMWERCSQSPYYGCDVNVVRGGGTTLVPAVPFTVPASECVEPDQESC
jgi:hypothetical protein